MSTSNVHLCKALGCSRYAMEDSPLCDHHQLGTHAGFISPSNQKDTVPERMSARYPKYYKSVEGLSEIDVYAVHQLFDIQDPSGAIQHASKKLLLSGVRTGGKSMLQDITEARDTLTRWIDLQKSIG